MKRWFQSRHLREQLLVAVFVVLAGLIWLSSAAGRARGRLDDWRGARTAFDAQQLWLDRQAEIEAQAGAAVQNLDPARTFDATRLVATVTTLATAAGLSPSTDPPHTERTPQFAYHAVRVSFRRAGLAALLNFYDELSKQAPYLHLESITMQTDRAAPGQLGVTLQISATQITKQAGG